MSEPRCSLAEVTELTGALESRTGLDYGRFTAEFLGERLAAHLSSERLSSVTELLAQVAGDPRRMARLLLALSIRPPGLFPEPALVRVLREQVCPRLRTYPSIRVWHAGCSTGEDVYATALVLREEGLLQRTVIYATDMSESVLERARQGHSTAARLAAAEERYRASGGTAGLLEYYHPDGDLLVPRPLLREHIVFAEHALGSDGSLNEFHLIVCRGILAQLRPSFQDHARSVIRESLCMFGFLFLGELDDPGQGLLRAAVAPLAQDGSCYRRVR